MPRLTERPCPARSRLALGLTLFLVLAPARGDEAVTVRIDRPSERLAQVLALFEGARAPHPAAALAAWRQATGRHEAGGKSAQALLASLNPEMGRELVRFDQAVLRLGFPPGPLPARWSVRLPNDDGTFAALAQAIALTEGSAEPEPRPDGTWLDRLGRAPEAPLAAVRPDGTVLFASDVAALDEAIEACTPLPDEGWDLMLSPRALAADRREADPTPVRLIRWRAAAALEALGCESVQGRIGLEGDELQVEWRAQLAGGDLPPAARASTVEPVWLDWVPGHGQTAGVVTLALDPGAYDRLTDLADRIEKADPQRAGTAPIRTRLELLALAAGIRPIVLRSPLRGLTLIVASPEDEPATAGVREATIPALAIVAHAWDEASALALEREARRQTSMRLSVDRDGLDVLIGSTPEWAGVCRDARDRPDPSGTLELRRHLENNDSPIIRAGMLWPRYLDAWAPEFVAPEGPLAAALDVSPPMIWIGERTADGETTTDRLRWAGLRGTIRRFLEQLPMAPTPTGAVAPTGENAPP